MIRQRECGHSCDTTTIWHNRHPTRCAYCDWQDPVECPVANAKGSNFNDLAKTVLRRHPRKQAPRIEDKAL
jgi:hypothetical protein